MLDDEKVTSLKKNQWGVSVSTGPGSSPVYLLGEPERRAYANYGMALTTYLLGDAEQTKIYVNKARAVPLDPDVGSEVKRLVAYDAKMLQEEQDSLGPKAAEFVETFM